MVVVDLPLGDEQAVSEHTKSTASANTSSVSPSGINGLPSPIHSSILILLNIHLKPKIHVTRLATPVALLFPPISLPPSPKNAARTSLSKASTSPSMHRTRLHLSSRVTPPSLDADPALAPGPTELGGDPALVGPWAGLATCSAGGGNPVPIPSYTTSTPDPGWIVHTCPCSFATRRDKRQR